MKFPEQKIGEAGAARSLGDIAPVAGGVAAPTGPVNSPPVIGAIKVPLPPPSNWLRPGKAASPKRPLPPPLRPGHVK